MGDPVEVNDPEDVIAAVLVGTGKHLNEPRTLMNALMIVAALEEAGFAIVPVEPTEAMRTAMADEYDPAWMYANPNYVSKQWASKSWKAALAAARENE